MFLLSRGSFIMENQKKVLVVTGSMVSYDDKSLLEVIRKQIDSFKISSAAWQDIQQKISASENLIGLKKYLNSNFYKSSSYYEKVDKYLNARRNSETPQLTEVSLCTLLKDEGIDFEVTTFSKIYSDKKLRKKLLDECSCIFASSSLIRDRSELIPLLKILKRPQNKVVVGGALAGFIHNDWVKTPEIDVLAVGYGEMLVPVLSKWIKNNYQNLEPPKEGRLIEIKGTQIVYSGVPQTLDLDFLRLPDWSIAEDVHQKKIEMVYYESVRGCPYRCAFCNYPFLFDDKKFRYRSAKQIVLDWESFANQGYHHITCLDSLFTMPRKRLVALCQELIDRQIPVKWICFARADDLADLEVCEMMKKAGCYQVQIGIESGSQGQLDNMNKRCTVEKNLQAVHNCQKVGITTLTSVIIGFPGETKESVEETYQFLKQAKPDMYYAALWSTRVENVPIMNKVNREKFEIESLSGFNSSAPYWKHKTMSSPEACHLVADINKRVMSEKISLDASLFYQGFLDYNRSMRDDLLDFQYDLIHHTFFLKKIIQKLNLWALKKLKKKHHQTFKYQLEY